MKALYISEFKKLWKTHDLVGLLVELEEEGELMEICDELNRHYIDTRYPIETEYTEEIVKDAVEKSEKVVKWAKKILKKEN